MIISQLNAWMLYLMCWINAEAYRCNYQSVFKSEFYTESQSIYYESYNLQLNNIINNNNAAENLYNGNIRIYFDYTEKFLNDSLSQYIRKIIFETIKSEFYNFLRVKRGGIDNQILVSRQCLNANYTFINGERVCLENCQKYTFCAGVIIPEKYLKKCLIYFNNSHYESIGNDGSGISKVDLVIIVDMLDCALNEIAKSRSCFHDRFDRPNLGTLILCRGIVKESDNPRWVISIVKHELIHTLGFDSMKFRYFLDDRGFPIIPRNSTGLPNVINNEKILLKKSRNRKSIFKDYSVDFLSFQMKNTLNEARQHFNCSDLDGVDLEDVELDLVKANHFDELIYGTEIMTPITDYELDVTSRLTLAFLEDTGWYTVNYDYAEIYIYAKASGCTLTLNGCYDYLQKNNIKPFCDYPIDLGAIYRCHGRDYYEFCNLQNWRIKMPKYSYFKKLPGISSYRSPYYYGARQTAEYCPLNELLRENGYANSICYDKYNTFKPRYVHNFLSSYYGRDSECFEHDIINAPRSIGFYGAACHKIELIGPMDFWLFVQNTRYYCQYGKSIKVIKDFLTVVIHCGTRQIRVTKNGHFIWRINIPLVIVIFQLIFHY